MTINPSKIDAFRRLLDVPEREIFDFFIEVTDRPSEYERWKNVGFLEAFIAFFQFTDDRWGSLSDPTTVNWQYSVATIGSEIFGQMLSRAVLRPNQRYFTIDGIHVSCSKCGNGFPGRKLGLCQDCRRKRKLDGVVREIDEFIKNKNRGESNEKRSIIDRRQ